MYDLRGERSHGFENSSLICDMPYLIIVETGGYNLAHCRECLSGIPFCTANQIDLRLKRPNTQHSGHTGQKFSK